MWRHLMGIHCVLLLPGCADNHSALHPTGMHAAQIAHLWWIFFYVCAVVYVLVIAFLVFALWRSRSRAAPRDGTVERRSDRKAWLAVGTALALTTITLVALAVSDFLIARVLTRQMPDPLRISITGHQWWWEIEYESEIPSQRVRTANELHIPVGRPVELSLHAGDVIHSFWVPNIAGKRDLIPGHEITEFVYAQRPGVYTGQCAEFCGYQHAKMRLVLHAQTSGQFEAWRAAQLQSARTPATDLERRGQEVFLSSSCILCHSIQGTPASATVAPDLTHIGSRSTIAAGALPNTESALASWILDPQRIKPGALMPANSLPPDDLAAIARYLASLE